MSNDFKKAAVGYVAVKASLDLDKIKEETTRQVEETKKLRLVQEEMAEAQAKHNRHIYELQQETVKKDTERQEREDEERFNKQLQQMIDIVEPIGLSPFAGMLLVYYFEAGNKMSTQRAITRLKEIASAEDLDVLLVEKDPSGKKGEKLIADLSVKYKIDKTDCLEVFSKMLFDVMNDKDLSFSEPFTQKMQKHKDDLESKMKAELEEQKKEKEREILHLQKNIISSKIKNYWLIKDLDNLIYLCKDNGLDLLLFRNACEMVLSNNSFLGTFWVHLLSIPLLTFVSLGAIFYGEGVLRYLGISGVGLFGIFAPYGLYRIYKVRPFLLSKRDEYLNGILGKEDNFSKTVAHNFETLSMREQAYFYGVTIPEILEIMVMDKTSLVSKLEEKLLVVDKMAIDVANDKGSVDDLSKMCALIKFYEERINSLN